MLEKLAQKLGEYIWPLLFLSIFIIPQNPELMKNQYTVGALFATFVIAIFLRIRLNSILLSLAFSYFSACAIFVWSRPFLEEWAIMVGAWSHVAFILIVLSACLIGDSERGKIIDSLALVCLGSSLMLIFRKLIGWQTYSFMNNSAADAAMIAVLYPVLLSRKWLWALKNHPLLIGVCLSIPAIAVGVSGSNTGVLGLVFATAIFHLFFWKNEGALKIGGSICAIALVSVPLLFAPGKFLNDNWRFIIWKFSSHLWWTESLPLSNQHLFGTGGGTWYYLVPMAQSKYHVLSGVWFAWAHNEYLQVTFEQGFIGIALLAAVAGMALKKSFDRPWLFSTLATYGFIMMTQFPFRYFASALIGALLVVEAFRNGKRQGKT